MGNRIFTLKNNSYILIIEGILIGMAVSIFIGLFRFSLSYVETIRDVWMSESKTEFLVLLIFISFVGVCICLKKDIWCSGSGIPRLKSELDGNVNSNWISAIITMFVGCTCTIGIGMSMGKIGPAVLIGSLIAKGISHSSETFKRNERLFMLAGVSAGFSAILNAPIAGVLFALEETNRRIDQTVVIISAPASIASWFIIEHLFKLEPMFSVETINNVTSDKWIYVILLAVLTGLFGILYNISLEFIQNFYRRINNVYINVAIPIICTVLALYFYPMICGGGDYLITEATFFDKSIVSLLILFVFKYIFTMICFGSGVPGGLIGPVIVIGGIFGGTFANICGCQDNIGMFILLAMAGYLAAVINTPLTSILLFCEIAGTFTWLPAIAITVLIAYIISDGLKSKPVFEFLLEKLDGTFDDNI